MVSELLIQSWGSLTVQFGQNRPIWSSITQMGDTKGRDMQLTQLYFTLNTDVSFQKLQGKKGIFKMMLKSTLLFLFKPYKKDKNL